MTETLAHDWYVPSGGGWVNLDWRVCRRCDLLWTPEREASPCPGRAPRARAPRRTGELRWLLRRDLDNLTHQWLQERWEGRDESGEVIEEWRNIPTVWGEDLI